MTIYTSNVSYHFGMGLLWLIYSKINFGEQIGA